MNADFIRALTETKEIVWPEIQNYLKNLVLFPGPRQIPPSFAPAAKFHQEIVSDYPKRQGKYLRPTLTRLTALAMGVAEEEVVKTAAAMQVSEDWILNHDDIEDNSWERRGKPTLHRLYGMELAVNAGDALHVLMWKILGDNEKLLGERRTLTIINEFYAMLTRTILGQTAEIRWTQSKKYRLTEKEIFFIIDGKTGDYTVAGPMRLGAILANADEDKLRAIYSFGMVLGRAFQIKDDLLDLTSDFSGLKKQQGNDIYEGKRTVMLAHLFRISKGSDKKNLESIMRKDREEKTKTEVRQVVGMMGKYGSLDYARMLIGSLAGKARRIFDKRLTFLSRSPYKDQIRAGIDFVVERKY